ncbi:MAG: hypothetical protein ACKO0Z_06290 [Betaproteobacteria bacterium]
MKYAIEHEKAQGAAMPRFFIRLTESRVKSFSYASGNPDIEERARARAEGYLAALEENDLQSLVRVQNKLNKALSALEEIADATISNIRDDPHDIKAVALNAIRDIKKD